MNVVQFWKELALSHKSDEDFYTTEEFISALDKNVPEWRQQVRNKDLWPELHTYTNYINECFYISAIINEVGIEYACYLVEKKSEPFLDEAEGLFYVSNHLDQWFSLSKVVQSDILELYLREFLMECSNNHDYWNSLTQEQKDSVLTTLRLEETKYVSDLL